MSNYPPGVTGFEPEIAGYDEFEQSLDCGAEWEGEFMAPEGVVLVSSALLVEDSSRRDELLRSALGMIVDVSIPCEWSGVATVYWSGGQGTWECPRCGKSDTVYPDEEEE